jgi:hypothetical protein
MYTNDDLYWNLYNVIKIILLYYILFFIYIM